ASYVIAAAIVLAIPLFIFFGSLSDKIGRKRIMMAGCLLAVLSYYPLYQGMAHFAGNNVAAIESTPDPITKEPKLTPVAHKIDAAGNSTKVPVTSAPNANLVMLTLLIFVQMVWVTMVYAPIAAYLVEAFPAKVRYTSLSLPYHIGNGVFGGLLPTIGLVLCAQTGNIFAGLWYPMIIAGVTFVVGSLTLPETHDTKIWEELEDRREHGLHEHPEVEGHPELMPDIEGPA
ncbi:MAG TPA: hypothetical protein PKO33_08065, partial [Pyrinomonadaceae bacterium]|nr:hypothetical protein [Pyrinomonadaceae bacterium]